MSAQIVEAQVVEPKIVKEGWLYKRGECFLRRLSLDDTQS